MSRSKIPSKKHIPAETYTKDYFESCCQGFAEFESSKGIVLPQRLSIPLKLADIQKGMNVVDVGCGRGEIVIHSAHFSAYTWGLDYSFEALSIAHKLISNEENQLYKNYMAVQLSKSDQLPFASESVDLVFMLDVVEHLYPDELKNTLDEAWRILREKGRLVIHTMPNLNYYQYGYPIYRFIQRVRRVKLPSNPRERWNYSHVHVNEQTPKKLKEELKSSKFQAKVWLYPAQEYNYEGNPIMRFGMKFLTYLYPFRWIFCNDIFSVGIK
jgi:ubiquinone/menaquinone biosynthesis C-methylase UbiE